MPQLSRRALLAGAGLGAAATTAGYGYHKQTEESPNEAKISSVHVNIAHEQSHTVDLLIMDNEQPVYLQSKTFEGNPDPDDIYSVGGGGFENLPEEPGEYVIWLQLDGRRWDRFDMSRWDSLPAGWEEGDFPDSIYVGYSIGHEGREEGPPAVNLIVGADDLEDSEE